MDIISAYREVGTYRGAAAMCGTTPKTVKRVIARQRPAGPRRRGRRGRRNYDEVVELVAARVEKTEGPDHARSGCCRPPGRRAMRGRPATSGGWSRRRRALWRSENHRGRRPAVWSPGEHLVIDWGVLGGLHVFCAVLAWSRVRFVRFADNERADTTLALLAECFEALGGVPAVVLADRMGCLKGGVVAELVVPTADYVRFATHYGFRPDFCEAARPGVEGHRGEPGRLRQVRPDDPRRRRLRRPFADLAAANAAAAAWCAEVNAAVHAEICAVPAERLRVERELLAPLPSLRAGIGSARDPQGRPALLRPVRLGPLLGPDPAHRRAGRLHVEADRTLSIIAGPGEGEVIAEHRLVAPG